jgi:cell wall-associated NlpC family hydrolase
MMVHPACLFWLLIASWMVLSCAAPGRYIMSENTSQASPEEAVRNAREYLANCSDWKIDCSRFVLACYHSGKMNHYLNHQRGNHNLVRDLNTYLESLNGRRIHAADIRPGDILIFNKTYDINHDGHIDDRDLYTHAGIVENYQNFLVTYIDASDDRKAPRIHLRRFSFTDDRFNETVAKDPATGRKIHARETFHAAYAVN